MHLATGGYAPENVEGMRPRRILRYLRPAKVQLLLADSNKAHRELAGKLADYDILLSPSLYDSGGWVNLETMAAGRPVVCLDLEGPGLQVTENAGIKVAAISPEQVTTESSRWPWGPG